MDKTKSRKKALNTLLIYFSVFYVLAILVLFAVQMEHTYKETVTRTETATRVVKGRVEARIDTTLKLVESLAKSDTLKDDTVDGIAKSYFLDNYSENLGYMMVRYVDEDMWVWNEQGRSASLASRDYIQRLFATGESQVTDVFAAGKDGVTLNYTVAAAIKDDSDNVIGSVFAAIYFTEIDELIKSEAEASGVGIILLSSAAKVMQQAGYNYNYGDDYSDIVNRQHIMGTNSDVLEEAMLNKETRQYWQRDVLVFYHSMFSPVKDTNWTILVQTDSLNVFAYNPWTFIVLLAFNTIAIWLVFFLATKIANHRADSVDDLLRSIQQLERQVYQNDNPGDVNFKQILTMTEKGLTDGLTGVVTRTVFMDRVMTKVTSINPEQLAVVIFVDVDDLKLMNDNYGHEAGDDALKEVGYVLRKYEKKYDGIVGRYGGDEFIVFLTGFVSAEDIDDVVGEISDSLDTHITLCDDRELRLHCSIGATIFDGDLTSSMKRADEALYVVKRTGKNGHKMA